MNPLKSIPTADLGQRLRHARKNAGLTQKDAASGADIARSALAAVEQGRRTVRINELQSLARRFGVPMNTLLRREAVHGDDMAPRFRKRSDAGDESVDEAVKILARLSKAEVELENLLGIEHKRNYPPERPIQKGNVRLQAEHDALELRRHLGLGNAPITDIVTLLEMEMGVRVYTRCFNAGISGLFVFDEQLGACILLNANHPKERRNHSAAHECGHLVSTRSDPEVLRGGQIIRSREERYADSFARSLLTPPGPVMQQFRQFSAGSKNITRRHVIVLAHFFGVSPQAMVCRLEELKAVKPGTWDRFEADGGITDYHVNQVLGDRLTADLRKADARRPVSLRLSMLAYEAHRRDIMTEGQLMDLLGIERLQLREILDEIE